MLRGKGKGGRQVQAAIAESMQHARWLNGQFILFLQMKRREVLARSAISGSTTSGGGVAAVSGKGDDEDDWVIS